MRKVWNGIQIVLICLLILGIMCVVLLSAATTFFLNRSGWDLQGYRAFTVESDTAGSGYVTVADIAVVKAIDSALLEAGDVVIYCSEAEESYGKMLVGVIETVAEQDAVLVGTEELVSADNIQGEYVFTVPHGSMLFQFLKTEKGFFLCVILPVLLVVLLFCSYNIGNFVHYRKTIRKKLQQKEENAKMLTQEQLEQSREAVDKILSGKE